ncbi:carbonic anhydrase [Treponema sp. R8-4-B8]
MKIHQPGELIEDANVALQMLKEGNERYLKGALIPKTSYSADREVLNSGQKPFAVILTCADSRAAPEIFFDQKLGDIFVIRNAGNVADKTALGSIEYAVEHLKSKLVVVCGHGKCGAVTAACSGGELPPNIKHIVDHIMPAVKKGGDIDKVVHTHVAEMLEQVKADEIVKRLGVKVVGAYYDIHSGAVEWL